jgi:aquaporin NIP
LWEVVLTFFLMFVIMAVATDARAVGEAAALAIGGTVALDALFGGPITGASMNPARSAGPAIAAAELSELWIYLAAPIAGASLGALAYQLLRSEPTRPGELAEDSFEQPDARKGVMSERVAIVTDLHANLPALEAALARNEERSIERI